MTLAPCDAACSATAKPIPDEPPSTTTRLSCKPFPRCIEFSFFALLLMGVFHRGLRWIRTPLLQLCYSSRTTQPVVPESLCPSPSSLLIPDDLDSTHCPQSRSEDLEHLQAATKSPSRLLGDRIARAY